MTTLRNSLAGAALAALLALSACANGPTDTGYSGEDCDADDIAEMDEDCGYWDASGAFVYWYWVGSYGGYRPPGWTPDYPPGSHRTRPANARPSVKPTTQSRPRNAPPASVPRKAPPTMACQAFGPPKPPPAPRPPAPKPAPPKPAPPQPKPPTGKAPAPKPSAPKPGC